MRSVLCLELQMMLSHYRLICPRWWESQTEVMVIKLGNHIPHRFCLVFYNIIKGERTLGHDHQRSCLLSYPIIAIQCQSQNSFIIAWSVKAAINSVRLPGVYWGWCGVAAGRPLSQHSLSTGTGTGTVVLQHCHCPGFTHCCCGSHTESASHQRIISL